MKATLTTLTKLYIRDLIYRYVKQAKHIASRYPVKEKHVKLNAADKILRYMDYYVNNDIDCHFKLVVKFKEELRLLMPAPDSPLKSWRNKINDLITHCEGKTKEGATNA